MTIHCTFSDEELIRYGRVMIMEDVGEEGMAKIRKGKVLVVGMGGLGVPASMYLVAGGIGEIHIADDDKVESSNLSRQILYRETDMNLQKVDSASRVLASMNTSCHIIAHDEAIVDQNVHEKIENVDIVVDSCDCMETKLLLSDACKNLNKPFVFATAQGSYGEACLFWPQAEPYQNPRLGQNSCLRCMIGDARNYLAQSARCDTVGVWGPVVGMIGSYQALRVLQWFVSPMRAKRGMLYVFDGSEGKSETIEIPKDPHCRCDKFGI